MNHLSGASPALVPSFTILTVFKPLASGRTKTARGEGWGCACVRGFLLLLLLLLLSLCVFCCTFFFVVPLVSTRHTDALARDDTERVHKFDPTEAHGGKIRSPKRRKNSPPPLTRSHARSLTARCAPSAPRQDLTITERPNALTPTVAGCVVAWRCSQPVALALSLSLECTSFAHTQTHAHSRSRRSKCGKITGRLGKQLPAQDALGLSW